MILLAVDLGDVRTGLAACDRMEMLAAPVGVVEERNRVRLLARVAETVRSLGAEAVVVGLPVNMDGSHGSRAERCEAFAESLRAAVDVPVRMWDERGTTVSAHMALNVTDTRGKRRKAVIDKVAAVIILESYLAWRKNHPDEL